MARGEDAEERRVWELLTKDFRWDVPPDHPVQVHGARDGDGPTRLQVFEMVVPTILSRIQPEFSWLVTANLHDSGLDFKGTQQLLDDEMLGIDAAITIGGQCKKRSRVDTVLDEIGGAVLTMADAFDPTFIVVALSARLTRDRVVTAQERIERQCRRHCRILDREQIENLIGKHLPVIDDILRAALDPPEVDEVLRYFGGTMDEADPLLMVDADPPDRVLAGEPFDVAVTIRSTFVSLPGGRVWWTPTRHDGVAAPVRLIGPVGAETPSGVAVATASAGDDVFVARFSLELEAFAVGSVDLGELLIGHEDHGLEDPWERVPLGEVQVIENVRPRFFERPFRTGMARLEDAFERAPAKGVETIGVVGAGGSGKSRLCEEFALGRRREGSRVVSAKQAKTHDDPHRVLADLLLALADVEAAPDDDDADIVIRAVRGYDRALADKATPTVRALFGTAGPGARQMVERDLLSALIVLVTAQAHRAPLIIHLQDLHWCTTDVLKALQQLIGQLEHVLAGRRRARGVLVVLEGRVHESHDGTSSQAWSSIPFEAFLERLDGTVVTCGSFDAADGLAFVGKLFEHPHSADGIVPEELLDLQDDLIRRIDRSAGSNPLHALEQVQLLKERGVLGQNPQTGLLYTIRPVPEGTILPDSVFASIQVRWEYLRDRTPDLALLLWACALLEDRLPATMFRQLCSELAPDVSVRDVDATDLVWTGDGGEQEVVFRHENYFEALRRFDVPPDDRARAVAAYASSYAGQHSPGPLDRFRWARVLLEAPDPDRAKARSLLRTARRAAERQGDEALARRISATELDLAWADDDRSPHPLDRLLRWADQELALSEELLGLDRTRAGRRITALRERLGARLASGRFRDADVVARVRRRQLAADLLQAKYLFDAQSPDLATRIADAAVHQIAVVRAGVTADQEEWDALEMEALHTHAVALAIGGEVERSIPLSEAAVQLARRRPTERGRQVIGTHGNILLGAETPAGVALLRECLADAAYAATDADLLVIHLSIGQALLAHEAAATDPVAAAELRAEARAGLARVVDACLRLGLYPDAGAAALMLGIISVLEDDEDAVSWFAQAVSASARGGQMETLWKAHLDLAFALHRWEGRVTPTVRDHARAALDLMEASLPSSAQPDRSPRFERLRVPLAHAVRLLVLVGDEAGRRTLERLPALRSSFVDPDAGVLREDRGRVSRRRGVTMRVGDADYVPF